MAAPCMRFSRLRWFILNRFVSTLTETSSSEIPTHEITSLKETQKKQNEEKDIIIPKRISRGPTDILKALASTVGKDYTAAHYKYLDDPYLIPASNAAKRTYSLAKESGKKAARFFLEKFPEGFKNDPADPVVKAFNPPMPLTEIEMTEATLLECIENVEVKNAMVIYQNIVMKGEKLRNETKQSLLELLCFYNCQDPFNEDYVEEKWFRQSFSTDTRRTWKDGDFADQVFNSMDDKDSAAYCTMIQGLAKHFDVDRAYALYEEMRAKQLPGSVELYNGMINLAFFLKEGSESRWELAEKFVYDMMKEKITPNLGTMNALLQLLSKLPMWQKTKSLALLILGEMKRLNIEPSLGSYYFILIIFCRERGPVSLILHDIMKHIKGKQHEVRHPNDVFFFVTAMDVCHNHLMDKDLAYSVHDLMEHESNCALMGDSYKESIYYQHLFKLLCKMENIDTFFNFYNKYVPHIYIPEPSVLVEIIKAIELSDALHYIPQLWSDIIVFEHSGREKIVEAILSLMAKSKQEVQLQKQFVTIAWDIKERIDSQEPSRTPQNKIQWSGELLGNILTVCLNGEDSEKTWELLYRLQREEHKILGYPSLACLKQFCTFFLMINQPDKVLFCLKYALEAGYHEMGSFITKAVEKYEMNELYRSKMEDILKASPLDTSNASEECIATES